MLLKALIKNNIISEEEKIFYQHGLDILINTFWLIATICTIGYITRMLVETVIFLIVFIGVRCFTGGYHAKKRWKCYCVSNLVYLTILSLTKMSVILEHKFMMLGCIILSIYSMSTIWRIAPIIGINSIKSKDEIQADKVRSRVISISFLIGAILGMMLLKKIFRFFLVIVLTVTAVAVLLKISYYIKEKEK